MKAAAMKIVRLVFDRWQAKVVSLVVAVLLSWYVHDSRNATRTIQVRVEVPPPPEHLVFGSRLPTFVNVQIRGPKEQMNFPTQDFKITLTSVSTRLEAGDNTFQTRLVPDPPPGMTAEYPGILTVFLDRLAVRELPVVPLVEVRDESMTAGHITLERATIFVQGPYRVLMDLDRIATQLVVIEGKQKVFSGKVPIGALPEFIQLTPNQRADMGVVVRLRGKGADGDDETLLHKVPLRCLNENPAVTAKFDVDTVDLIVAGDKNATADQFTARVFCPAVIEDGKLKSKTRIFQLPIRVEDKLHRPTVQIVQTNPPRANVLLEQAVVRPQPDVQQGLEDHSFR
ncbi:MAG: hypothetical protein HY042_01350 [Spirochaetia bacterium]|nr:hypothetical protein [Spirochaetia bacterium]